jgi:hypothetical protein
MGERESSDQQRATGRTALGPSLRGLIWWRFGIALATLAVIVAVVVPGLHEAANGCMGFYAGLYALLVGSILFVGIVLPSLLIAAGFRQGSRGAIRFALIHDSLILVVSMVVIIYVFRRHWWEPVHVLRVLAPWVGLCLASGAEAWYVLRRVLR